MPDRAAGRDRLRRRNDGIRVDAIVAIKIRQRPGLTAMFDAEWSDAMAGKRAEPCQCCRVSVEHADDSALRRHIGEQALDVRTRMNKAPFAGALSSGPAGVETIS